MREKLKHLGEGISAAYVLVETHIRNHFWYILVILVVTFILSLSKGSDADRLSFASSTLSIALALVIVLYTFCQSSNMANLISSIPNEIEKAAHIFKEQTDTIKEQTEAVLNKLDRESEANMARKVEESLPLDLNLSMCSHLTKIAFYCFVKADNLGKRINTKEILEKLDYKLDPPNEIVRRTWLLSIFNLISACVKPECTKVSGGGWNITSLDPDFKGNVDKSIRQEIESGNSELETDIRKIDEYVGGLKKSVGGYL